MLIVYLAINQHLFKNFSDEFMMVNSLNIIVFPILS